MKKLIFLLVLFLAACAPANTAQIDPPFPKPGPLASTAHVYPVETGWQDGKPVRYYNMGTNTPLDPANPLKVLIAGVWVFATGANTDGSPIRLEGQDNILDSAPGDEIYSDLWQVHFVTPSAGFNPNSVTSLKALNESGLKIEKQPMIVNCPFVPTGSSLKNSDLKLQKGWVNGQSFDYFDFGPTDPRPGELYAFVTGFNADGTPKLVAGQHFIFGSERKGIPYSDFLRVRWVVVETSYQADSIKSVEEIDPSQVKASDIIVNYPLK